MSMLNPWMAAGAGFALLAGVLLILAFADVVPLWTSSVAVICYVPCWIIGIRQREHRDRQDSN
jgi:hypothetical protein